MARRGWTALAALLAGAAHVACAGRGPAPQLPGWARLAVATTPCPAGAAPLATDLPEVRVVRCLTPEGVTHGWKASYWASGRRALFAEYRLGRPHGFTTSWHPSGRPRFEARWRDGRRHGRFTSWYEDGRVSSSVLYREGMRDGIQLDYYPSGSLLSLAHFRDGVQHGPVVAYHPNGLKQIEGSYWRGVPHGPWRYWDSTGSLDTAIAWRDGQQGGCCLASP